MWSLITVKMKSTSIMETGRQKVEDIKWNPIKKKVGHWVSQSFGSECRTAAASFVQVSMFLCKGDRLHQYKTAR